MNTRKLGIPSLPIAAKNYSVNTIMRMPKGKKSPVKPHPVTCSTCGKTGTQRKDASGKRICSECWGKLKLVERITTGSMPPEWNNYLDY